MRYHFTLLGAGLVGLSVLVGCATGDRTSLPTAVEGSTQQDTADAAMRYRQEAANLREMAQRQTIEAEVLEQKEGSDSENVKRNKQLVQELLTTANAAEEKARELRKDVPHGMVQ